MTRIGQTGFATNGEGRTRRSRQTLAGAVIPLEFRDAVEGRYLAAAVHLALFLIVVLLPSRSRADGADVPEDDAGPNMNPA